MVGRLCFSLALAALALGLAAPGAARADDPPFVGWAALLPGLAAPYEPTSEDDCVAGRTKCVDKVVAEMRRRFDPLARSCDHDAIFALSYLRTTQEYRRTIEDPGFFEDTACVNHEDAVFARYYFEAYDAWHRGQRGDVPAAWRHAFAAADGRELTAAGNLLLGINAHVMRDLPYVLAGIGIVKPDGGSRKADHDKVNVFLNRVTVPLREEIAARFDASYDDADLPTLLDETSTFQAVQGWREYAWRSAERLVGAAGPDERARVAADIEAAAATQALLLRQGLAYGPGSDSTARDAYCAGAAGDR